MNVSKNNFRDDFEKNRQSINSDDQFEDNTNEFDENSNESNDFDNQSDQQFPPRNAQRRQRRRNQATNKNRKFGNQNLIQMLMVHLMIDTMKTLSMSYNTINKKII